MAHPDNVRWATQGPVVRALMPSGVSRALDVGCGGGRYTEWLARRSAVTVGLDLEPGQLARLRKKAGRISPVCASAEALPFRAGCFDFILCTEVLEHLKNDGQALREAVQVLAEGGHILVSVPVPPAPYPDPAHVREGYTAEQLEDLLRSHGLQPLQSAYCMFGLSRALLRVSEAFMRRWKVAPPLLPLVYLEQWGTAGNGKDGQPFDLVILAERAPDPSLIVVPRSGGDPHERSRGSTQLEGRIQRCRMGPLLRRILGRAAMVLVGVLAALGLLEVGTRLFLEDCDALLTMDRRVGRIYAPGERAICQVADRPEGVPVAINSAGFRDREYPEAKAPGTTRVLLLGDSFTSAFQVPFERTFKHLLEKGLRARTGKPTDVLNLGVGGTGTGHQWRLLIEKGMRYSPGVVILMFFGGNDVQDNSLELSPGLKSLAFSLNAAGTLVGAETTLSPWERILYEVKMFLGGHSKLFRVVYPRLLQRRVSYAFFHRLGLAPPEIGYLIPKNMARPPDMYREDPLPAWVRAWAVTRALLSEVDRVVAGAGARLLVVGIPDRVAVSPVPAPEGYDFETPNRLLANLCADLGITYLDLLPRFRAEQGAGNELYFRIDGHFTEAGHGLTADMILGRLVAEGWLGESEGRRAQSRRGGAG